VAVSFLSDLVARTIVSPGELPVGIITSLVGAPFFIYLLVKNRSNIQ
jgi:iron complex transport system permease protein